MRSLKLDPATVTNFTGMTDIVEDIGADSIATARLATELKPLIPGIKVTDLLMMRTLSSIIVKYSDNIVKWYEKRAKIRDNDNERNAHWDAADTLAEEGGDGLETSRHNRTRGSKRMNPKLFTLLQLCVIVLDACFWFITGLFGFV